MSYRFLKIIATAGGVTHPIVINPAHIISAYPGDPDKDHTFLVLVGHEHALEITTPFDRLCSWLEAIDL